MHTGYNPLLLRNWRQTYLNHQYVCISQGNQPLHWAPQRTPYGFFTNTFSRNLRLSTHLRSRVFFKQCFLNKTTIYINTLQGHDLRGSTPVCMSVFAGKEQCVSGRPIRQHLRRVRYHMLCVRDCKLARVGRQLWHCSGCGVGSGCSTWGECAQPCC